MTILFELLNKVLNQSDKKGEIFRHTPTLPPAQEFLPIIWTFQIKVIGVNKI
ncbi:MAG: hypothetical protein KME49_24655 [Brasilonema octagenarum HA4186-MV1]|jgi:hypothetical protein|uniref:hypothetical protein n=1 Tax=Brasilonema sennae TaxID=1397703 RepID=UPI00155A4E2B|nr:hypothetical protein [Brasilonema sennae]MBW4628618.1 hypothetical protein [Brasilonema octagenarum HA4186-MV1]